MHQLLRDQLVLLPALLACWAAPWLWRTLGRGRRRRRPRQRGAHDQHLAARVLDAAACPEHQHGVEHPPSQRHDDPWLRRRAQQRSESRPAGALSRVAPPRACCVPLVVRRTTKGPSLQPEHGAAAAAPRPLVEVRASCEARWLLEGLQVRAPVMGLLLAWQPGGTCSHGVVPPGRAVAAVGLKSACRSALGHWACSGGHCSGGQPGANLGPARPPRHTTQEALASGHPTSVRKVQGMLESGFGQHQAPELLAQWAQHAW